MSNNTDATLDDVLQAARAVTAQFPDEYYRELDKHNEYATDFVNAATEAGLHTVMIPEEYGGWGLGVREASVITEEINYSGGAGAYIHATMFTMGIIARYGSAEQKAKWLPRVASSELRLTSFALTEPNIGTDTSKMQTTARYDERGIMGSGSWYGVPTYGEFVQVYYNKDMFAEAGVEVPTTLEEFEQVLQTFTDQGVTPLAEAAAEYPLGQLWYQLALTEADREWVDAYQLYTSDIDWQGPEVTFATETIADWTDKGYISTDATGLAAEDAGVAFINGTNPIFFSGSWWHGRFNTEVDFEWGSFLFPGEGMSPGSAGNMWVIPERSQNAELAEQFIDITMRPEIQALMGNNGGVPVAADPADIEDEGSAELIANFNTLNERDGIAFYPDWPTPTFYDELNAGLQELLNGTKSPAEFQEQVGQQYQAGIADIVG